MIRYNFYNAPERKVCSAVWFQKDGSSEKDFTLVPIVSTLDEMIIEEFYVRAVKAFSPLANVDPNSLLREEVVLIDAVGYKVFVIKVGGLLSLRKKPTSRISMLEGSTGLQRGYGNYAVDGEEEELALGPVKHLTFIIHGIGEAMWRREDMSFPSTVESVEQMRATINKKLFETWKMDCLRHQKQGRATPPPPNRIEFIPVEWYDKIHSSSSTLKNNLISTTLGTIPKLRAIANDVIFDVLMYLTPEFCEEVLNCVTDQIVELYDAFKLIHDSFAREG